MSARIGCSESNEVRPGLRPLASLTNYIGGEVSDPRLPPRTETTWGLEDGTEVLRDELDANGCRHYLLSHEDRP